MNQSNILSETFERAALKSESYRIIGLVGLLAVMMLFVLVRGLAAGEYLLLGGQVVVLALALVHEGLMLRALRKALDEGTDVEPVMWVVNVFVESQLPTIGLFILLATRWLPPSRVLVAPVVLVYLLLITLSALRLRPALTLLTGVLSALGYLFTVFYVQLRFGDSADQLADFARTFYYIYAALILAGGLVAAAVAAQIRNHVLAALREAELQNEIKRINHDLDIARSIQQGLLPEQSPALENFEIAGWNQPADQTGGDYFDWQKLPDGRYAISLGDATGHGIGPALVTASCRAYARASLLANGHRVLDQLNQLLAEDLPANRFVTFAVVLLDPNSSCVEVLSAGHGPILWYRRAGDQIESLEAQGIPLGMIATVKYEQGIEVRLDAGDMLVMVTDGFYEWENPAGEQFGLARLNTVIRESRECRAEEVIGRLRSAVENFCGGTKQQDDLTAVILKRNAAG